MSWGLVLSGGAAHGLCNGGVIEVLEENKMVPDSVAGSSMGAIIGALYAMRIPMESMHALVKRLSIFRIARPSRTMLQQGLHGGLLQQNIESLLRPVIGDACIGDCAIPFLCVAGRVRTPIDWKRIVFPGFTESFLSSVEPYVFPEDTRLIDAIMASSAIPVLFSPVTIGKNTFVDLVHFSSIPVRHLRNHCDPDIVVATDTTPRYTNFRKVAPKSWKEFLDRGNEDLEENRKLADLIITPTIPAQTWRFDRAGEFLKTGRTAMLEALPELHRLLSNPNPRQEALARRLREARVAPDKK